MGLFAELSTELPSVIKKGNFFDFWTAYPRRKGPNPRSLAEERYLKVIKAGADPEHLLTSVKKYRDESREQGLIDTPYICMAATWLNQKRWLDYAPDPGSKERDARIDADMARRGYKWNVDRWEKI